MIIHSYHKHQLKKIPYKLQLKKTHILNRKYQFLLFFSIFYILLLYSIHVFIFLILQRVCSISACTWFNLFAFEEFEGSFEYYYLKRSSLKVSPCRYICLFLLSSPRICSFSHNLIELIICKSLFFLHY